MCGIWGYTGNISPELSSRAHNFLYALASWSEIRGTDSTGFACRFDSGHIIVDKMPVRASVFGLLSHKWASLRRKMPSTLIGHTRFGTGSTPLINNNNHPFLGRDYHMVHNGVIPSWKDAQRNLQLPMQSETDSEVILRSIEKRMESKDDITRAVTWVLENIWGNMAVALLDRNNPNVYLFRNENPIWVFHIPNGIFGTDTIFFASTEEIFESAWKEVFKQGFAKSGVTAQYLDDNRLFRISTKAAKIDASNQKHKFIVYGLDVKKKYNKNKTYYEEVGYATHTSTSSSSADEFFSSLPNPDSPVNGCRFGKEIQEKLNKRMNEKDWEKVRIDGLPAKEYRALRQLMMDLESLENAYIFEGLISQKRDETPVDSVERVVDVIAGFE
jgi:glucosamine 6-phosphate synthetase-like amidotransferase/phosphosugar isomerase protein